MKMKTDELLDQICPLDQSFLESFNVMISPKERKELDKIYRVPRPGYRTDFLEKNLAHIYPFFYFF